MSALYCCGEDWTKHKGLNLTAGICSLRFGHDLRVMNKRTALRIQAAKMSFLSPGVWAQRVWSCCFLPFVDRSLWGYSGIQLGFLCVASWEEAHWCYYIFYLGGLAYIETPTCCRKWMKADVTTTMVGSLKVKLQSIKGKSPETYYSFFFFF